jgi:hypothetical protein
MVLFILGLMVGGTGGALVMAFFQCIPKDNENAT